MRAALAPAPSLRSALGLPLASLARGRSPPARPRAASSLPAGPPSTMPPYPIGTPGVPWGEAERLAWRARVEPAVTRSYRDEVVTKIDALRDRFDVVRYGALPYDAADPDRYPLFAVMTRNWSAAKPCVLVTGGVHGYETSGVQGALRFLETECANVQGTFNVLVAPCVSPWGYERVQRWNAEAVDPNRSFDKINPPPAVEAALLAALVRSQSATWLAHFDLHETTDTDESEFRPAKAARDGETCEPDVVPDGFYCVGDAENPRAEFQKAVVDAVREVTHIAPPDANGRIIGEPITQEGVIEYPLDQLMLCASLTGAKYTTTTEVYPDSPNATDEECNDAQVAAVAGGLRYVVKNEGL